MADKYTIYKDGDKYKIVEIANELRDQIAALFRYSHPPIRLGDQTPGEIADAVMAVVTPIVAESEESRFRWAEEAAHVTEAAKALLDMESACAPDGGRLCWSAWPPEYNDLAVAIGWRGAKRPEEYTLDDLTMTPEDHAAMAAQRDLLPATVEATPATADHQEPCGVDHQWEGIEQALAGVRYGTHVGEIDAPPDDSDRADVEPPTLAETRTGTDWCPRCRMEVGTNRSCDDSGTERCAMCWGELAVDPKLCNGVTLIALERDRQIAKGWNANHDDRHSGNQLVQAALFYADETASGTEWPWDTLPTRGTRIRDLERAGALIAAEIDRLHRAAGQS